MSNPTRNKDAGIPGNGGQYAATVNTPADETVALRTPYEPTRSVDVKVASSQAARERIKAGRPSWDETLHVGAMWRNEAVPYPERRTKFVDAVKKSRWYQNADEFSDLHDFIDELQDLDDEDDMKNVLSEIYDLADMDRVHLK